MAEIGTPPVVTYDENGNELVCFTADHTLSDIARWMMQNRADAETLRDLLDEALSYPDPVK